MSVLSMPDEPRSDDLLAWLRAREVVNGGGFSLNTSVLLAHAISGDGGAVRALAAQAAAPAWGRRTDAEQAIEALIGSRDRPAVLSAFGVGSPESLAFGGTTPAERLLGLRLLWRAGDDITPCLGDDSTMVARKAYDLLRDEAEPDPELLTMVQERRPGHLWALAVLHDLDYEIRPMWEELGSPRVEVAGVPPDVREAIVRQYAPGERDTDPRWLIEAALLAPVNDRDELEEKRLRLARGALAAAGLEPEEPLSAGDASGQGEGTFHTITTNAGPVSVSTLGPFFRFRNDDARIRTALQDAGFRNIDAELGAVECNGLHVYFFARRGPLQVNDLLFYWQD